MASLLISERFEVHLEGSHGIVIPDKIVFPFIEKGFKRVALKAYFEGREIDFHGALHLYKGKYMVSFGKRYQKELGIFPSDYFELQLIEDTTRYGVEMPEAFQAVLDSDPEASAIFEAFSDGKKRSLIYYLLRFKNEQTRIDKALIISENIKMGITNLKEIIQPLSN